MVSVEFFVKEDSLVPYYSTGGSSGVDLMSSGKYIIKSNKKVLIPTGLFLRIPVGWEGQIRSRSGLTLNHGLIVANGVGTIDSDYRGEIKIILWNTSGITQAVDVGDRIAQLVFAPVIRAEFIRCDKIVCDTDRGEGGFGSTGIKNEVNNE